MKDAKQNGTPVLVKIKDDLSPWGILPGDFGGTHRFAGLHAVMRNHGDIMGWCFAAPVGRGGFSEDWLEGWWPLPAAETSEDMAVDTASELRTAAIPGTQVGDLMLRAAKEIEEWREVAARERAKADDYAARILARLPPADTSN